MTFRSGLHRDVRGISLETAVLHHDQRSFMSANQARNVLGVRHRRAEHELVTLRVSSDQRERVRHFAIRQTRVLRPILEDEDSAIGRHLGRELRLAPADVHRRDDVIEEVGRDAAGVIPVFAETEEAVGIPGALGCAGPSHIFQSM